jgi:hypothetical protein
MSMFYSNAMRGYGLGAKYGIMEGLQRYQHTTETPKMDESAMQGAIGIIIAVGGVLIALYIIAVVVGSISYAVTSGNIKLSPTWNTTITKFYMSKRINTKSNRLSINQLKLVEIENGRHLGREYRFAGTGDLQSGKCPAYRHYRGGHSDDCDWRIQRSGCINLSPILSKRTLNMAYA